MPRSAAYAAHGITFGLRNMRERRFRGRQHWYNTAAWLRVSTLIGLSVFLFAAATGSMLVLWVAFPALVLSALVALVRDRGRRCTYTVEEGTIRLSNGRKEEVIALDDVQDTTLLNRSAAREYIQQRSKAAAERGVAREEIVARENEFTRFCTVDIGLRSFSFGLGRRLIDRMPEARQDLVLLRSRGGRDHLLSPVYDQDMVGAIAKAKEGRRRA